MVAHAVEKRATMVALVLVVGCASKTLTPDGAAADGADGPQMTADGAEDAVDGGLCGRIALSGMASFAIHLPSGDTVSCASGLVDAGTPPQVWSGVVISSDPTSIVVDTCGDTAVDGGSKDAAADAEPTDGAKDGACASAPMRVEVQAPGLDLSSFPHVRVRVRAKVTRFYQCQRTLEITAASGPLNGAEASPTSLLLAVVDGGNEFDGAPYSVAHVPLGCPGAPLCRDAGSSADEYALDFSGQAAATLRVYMGETAAWTLGDASYTVHNLRSFQQFCATDEFWDWAYTIYADPK